MFYIGIDIGTTSTKAILYDENGKIKSKSSVLYPIYSPRANVREQDPEEIFNAVLSTLKEVNSVAKNSGEEVEFISFSSMMHSLICVDKDANPLTNCIIWADSRSSEYAEQFKENGIGIEIYKRTGTPCHSMSPLYKIMWLRDNESEIFKNTFKFISIKEYVIYKLFGEYLVDYSIASATGLFNIYDLKWDDEALNLCGIEESKLSIPYPTTYIIEGMLDKYREVLKFDEDIKVVLGASDGCLANLGSNGIDFGTAVVSIGTSGAVRTVSNRPIIDDKGRTFSYILTDNMYVSGGAINNGGITYRWFRDTFCSKEVEIASKMNIEAYDLINKMVENVKPSSEGLIFLPFLTGERAPYWNSNLRGSYIGISDMHKREHFARSTIEGICFAINDVFRVLKETNEDIKCVYVNGGFTKSKCWVQTLTDCMDTKIIISDNYESPTLGALMLGLLAIGRVKTLKELDFMLEDGEVFFPTQNKEKYKELFQIYQNAVSSMTNVLSDLAHFQNKL